MNHHLEISTTRDRDFAQGFSEGLETLNIEARKRKAEEQMIAEFCRRLEAIGFETSYCRATNRGRFWTFLGSVYGFRLVDVGFPLIRVQGDPQAHGIAGAVRQAGYLLATRESHRANSALV